MREIPAIVKAWRAMPPQEHAALATVISVEGSSYRRPGARLLVRESGQWVGGISGGCLEGDALRKAKRAILSGQASIVVYDTRDPAERSIGAGLGCNGRIEVLIAPLPPANTPHHPVAALERVLQSRQPQILITVLAAPTSASALQAGRLWPLQDEKSVPENLWPIADKLAESVARVRSSGRSEVVGYEDIQLFVEAWTPPLHIAVFGGHYDVYYLLRLAKELGCLTSVTTNLQKAHREHLADADLRFAAGPPVDAYTAIILMAHDYNTDLENLRWALGTPAPYIGLLGPRVRTEQMLSQLEAEGIPVREHGGRIFGPAGLDIGAASPEMIALSILAEIQACFAQREGGHLRLRTAPIYS